MLMAATNVCKVMRSSQQFVYNAERQSLRHCGYLNGITAAYLKVISSSEHKHTGNLS